MEGSIDGILPAEPSPYPQVHREADHLQRLVNDLQELSRVEAGAYELGRQLLISGFRVRVPGGSLTEARQKTPVTLAGVFLY